MFKERLNIVCWFLVALFLGSIFWINFHSAFWYDMDMALNSHEAGLVWKEKTLFPKNWVFGNQYLIVETPLLAAFFYGLTGQTTLSMSLASSFNTILILIAFIWCLKPFVSKQSITIGCLCIVGGTIFGTSAASYTKGLQVLYTMASYYASYLIVLLLTMGVWLRMKDGKKVHWTIWAGILILNFGIGMNSLREILILGIPLLLLSAIISLIENKNRIHFVFATMVFVAQVLGFLFMKSLHIPACGNVSDVAFGLSSNTLFANIINSSKNLARVSGIALAKDGLIYFPLTFCALIVVGIVLLVHYRIFKEKDKSPLAILILFCTLSVFGVYAAGVLVFKTRDIYFFIYWLLAALSVSYLIKDNTGKRVILCIALVSFFYHFIPDFMDYAKYSDEMKTVTAELVDKGYTVLYGDDCAVFAAASKDRIIGTPIRINSDDNSPFPLSIFPYNKDIRLYQDDYPKNCVVVFSNYYLNQINEIPSHVTSHFSLLHDLNWGKREIFLFTPIGDFSIQR